MLKLNPKCNVCKLIQTDDKLKNDIFNTNFYLKNTGRTLKKVYDEYSESTKGAFGYDSLLNHVRRHQFMNNSDFKERSLNKIKKKSAELSREGTIEAKDVWNQVIESGMGQLETGQMELKAADLLKATKDKSDYELKVKDQQLAFMEMVYYYASGESNESRSYDRRIVEGKTAEDYDPALTTSEDSGTRQNRPGGIHYPPTWDALTPGST